MANMESVVMSQVTVRSIAEADRPWIERACDIQWGTSVMVSNGRIFDIATQEGLVAERDGERVGLLTWESTGGECEIGGLLSLDRGKGVGSRLIESLLKQSAFTGWRCIWATTTNDNIEALRFYQKRGFEMVAVHRGAVDSTRRMIKPGIPKNGMNGIPLRDEIELEIPLK